MRYLPASILICVVIALALVNTDLFLPVYKGVQHPVGADIVSVYTIDDEASAPPVPIKRLELDSRNSSSAWSDTGERVHVYIKNTYRDDDIRDAHTRTIKVVSFFTLIYVAAVIYAGCEVDVQPSNSFLLARETIGNLRLVRFVNARVAPIDFALPINRNLPLPVCAP